MISVSALLVPPSPSVSTKRRVRLSVDGSSEMLRYVMFCINASTDGSSELAFSVITSGSLPLVPPVNVPMATAPAPKSYRTVLPNTLILLGPIPWSRIDSRSSAVPLAVKSTVSVPVSKSVESGSVSVAPPSMIVAGSFSV